MQRFALLAIAPFLASAMSVAQAPAISSAGIVNAASYAYNATISPGGIISMFGTALTNGTTAGAAATPLPTELAGARVTWNGARLPLFFASPQQINAQAPVDAAGFGEVRVEVQTSSGLLTSAPAQVFVLPATPGIFTWNQSGQGPGAILRNSDFTRICPPNSVCPLNRAVRGEYLAIYATGLGKVTGPWTGGSPASTPAPTELTPEVTIGGVRAEVVFSGLAVGFVGLYQINVRVPDISLTGDSTPLTVSMPGVGASNTVTVAIAAPVSANRAQRAGGPAGGNVRAIAADPASPDTVYAGTLGGGVFKSTNAGQTWTPMNSGLTARLVATLAVDPRQPATLYAGTLGGGIFKSTNAAQSWSAVNSGIPDLPFAIVSSIVVDPANSAVIFAGLASDKSGGQVLKSTNGGQTWSATGALTDVAAVAALAIDPATPATVYAATDRGVFKTANGGTAWTAVNSGLTATPVVEAPPFIILSLAIDPRAPATLYAGTVGNGVYKTTNGGQTWTAANGGFPSIPYLNVPPVVLSLSIDPSNSSIVYAGIVSGNQLDGVYKSTNAGGTWTSIDAATVRTAVFALAVNPATPATVYAGTFGRGVLKTTNAGTSWNEANAGLNAALVFCLAIDPNDSAVLYAGTGSGVFKSTNAGQTWSAIGGANSRLAVLALAIDPTSTSTLYAGIGVPFGAGSTGVLKSTDGGATWTQMNTGLPGEYPLAVVTSLAIDPSNPAVVFAGTFGGVFKSTNRGASWTAGNAGLPTERVGDVSLTVTGPIVSLAVHPTNSAIIYAVTPEAVFKSTNGGGAWSEAANGMRRENPPYVNAVLSVAIDRGNPNTLYAGTDAGVFKSTDGAANWTLSRAGLTLATLSNPDEGGSFVYSIAAASSIYVGTIASGIFRSADNGATWLPIGSGLGGTVGIEDLIAIATIVVDPRNPSVLYAGTPGAGVFKSADGGQTWLPTGN